MPRIEQSTAARGRRRTAAIVLVLLALLTAGCGQSALSSSGGSAGAIRVTAAENFWGSVATQLGGKKVAVTSIIVNPDTDPHSYEPTAADGRALASSQMAIVNGIGYDTWASKLLAANPSSGRVVLDVGSLLGLTQGDNPHQWYSPSEPCERVIAADHRRLPRLDPARRRLLRKPPPRIRNARGWPNTTACASRSAPATRASRSATRRASSGRWAKAWG